MASALYYPFTAPQSEQFLKTSLFLWDTLDFIVPSNTFRPHTDIPHGNEAIELFGQNYVPTPEDKQRLHDELMDVCTRHIPESFFFPLERPELAFHFYPQKLLDESWEMLKNSKLASTVVRDGHVAHASTGPLFGYYMMSLLAICCGGDRKRLITDEADPYRTLSNLLQDTDTAGPTTDPIDLYGYLISITLSGPDFSKSTLTDLIALRKREDKLLKDLRRSFLSGVDSTVKNIREHSNNPNTVRDAIREYQEAMEDDLKELKQALRMSATSLILSKESCVAALGLASCAVEPVSGGLLTVGGLTKAWAEFRGRRHTILRQHPSAWLLASLGGRLPAF